jgi:tRNA pseudouridine55 synthase
LLDGDKAYEFTVRFGEETATLDAEGAVVATSDVRPTPAEVHAVLPRFTGPIAQTPPAYSALKVDGRRAYDLARAGEDVTLASRDVTIYTLTSHPRESGDPSPVGGHIHGMSELGPRFRGGDGIEDGTETLERATLTAHVSKGTYIRSLARDIAHALGTVGHVTMLRRTKAGPFDLAHAITLDELAEFGQGRALEHHLLPLRAGLDDIPALFLTPDQAGALRQGRVLAGIAADDGQHFAMLHDAAVALVEVRDREVRVVRGFNL